MYTIGQNDINPSLTQKLNKNPKYAKFIEWLKSNGALIDERVVYPAAFGPNGYIGVTCSSKIQAFRTVIAIPKNLIIDVDRVKKTEQLSKIIQQNSKLFTITQKNDASFNILALYLIVENLKGQKSFFFPYFEAAESKNLLLHWTKNDLLMIENKQIFDNVQAYKDQLEHQFMQFLRVIRKYDKIFPSEINNQQYKKIFEWAYQFVMSRAFGWSVPSASLIPFADMLNHDQIYLDHHMVDIEKQNLNTQKYLKKKSKSNLNIFKKEWLVPTEEQFKKFRQQQLTQRKKYIKKHVNLLQKNSNQKDQKKSIHKILHQQYQANVHNIRQLYFAQSSCSQDNDTDQQDISDLAYHIQEFKIQDKLIQRGVNKTPVKILIAKYWKLFTQPKLKQLMSQESQGQQQMEQQKKNHEEKLSQSSKKSIISSQSDQQDEQFDWIKTSNPLNIYFVLFPKKIVNKGEQLYNFYGRRSNRFLLLGYNFAKINNKYDSFCFRMIIDKQNQKKPIISKIAFLKFSFQKKELKDSIMTRQIRLKKNRLNIDLINHSRCLIISSEVKDKQKILSITIPFDKEIELKALNLAKNFLSYFLSQYSTSVQQDQEFLENTNLGGRARTAITIRLSHKLIIKQQIKMVDKCVQFLGRWKKNRIQLGQNQMKDAQRLKQYLYSLERSKL